MIGFSAGVGATAGETDSAAKDHVTLATLGSQFARREIICGSDEQYEANVKTARTEQAR